MLPTTRRPSAPGIGAQLSGRLIGISVAATMIGLAAGAVLHENRSAVRETPQPGTAAWIPHLVLLAVAVVLLVGARARHRRRRPGRLLLLAPVGRSAEARLRAAYTHRSILRIALSTPLVLLCLYCLGRSGVQVIAGLDPNFTADAWGGPGYAGAMFCHYLDGALIIAAAANVLSVILPRPDAAP